MQFNRTLAALGTVSVAVSLIAGCSSSHHKGAKPSHTPAHYGVVQAHPKEATPIADWESRAVKVRCERDEYAVYKDRGHRSQKCYEPSKTAVMTLVNDWHLINKPKYWCGRGKKLSFAPGTKLMFCFEGLRATATPVNTEKATPTWKPSTPGTSNTVNSSGTPSTPKTLTPPKSPSTPKTLTPPKRDTSTSSSSKSNSPKSRSSKTSSRN